MIHLIYGPDTFRSRRCLANIVGNFVKSAGDGIPAVFYFDAEESDFSRILQMHNSLSLFSAKRIIVLERVFSAKKSVFSSIEHLLKEWVSSPDTTFVFWDGDCVESAALSRVKKSAHGVEEFSLLNGASLEKCAEEEIKRRDIKLSQGLKAALLMSSGGDLWKFSMDLDKYEVGGLFQERKTISEEKMWNFTDAFLVRKRLALASAVRLLSGGADMLYLMGALSKTLRATLALRDAIEKKIAISDVAQKLELKPFVANKQARVVRDIKPETLAGNYRLLLNTDENIKTGKLPAPIAFLSLFVKN
ncbi:MAG: hypothetical protein Q7R91_01750 [bacterium]|nr:hypothetical protein [bacterium]